MADASLPDMANTYTYTAEDIKDLPTLCVGQCCSLKVQRGSLRVWYCRVGHGVTTELLLGNGRWETFDGGCYSPEAAG